MSLGCLPTGKCWGCDLRLDDGSRMSGDVHVRFCESVGVQFPRATHLVICLQNKGDGERVLKALRERFAKFGLSLSEDKTRLIEFGRYAGANRDRRGEKPASFDYLGFTHFIDRTRRGTFKVGRRTSKKKFRAKIKGHQQLA